MRPAAPRRGPSRRRPTPAWLLPVAIGTVIAITGCAIFWFAYLRPLREQLDNARAYYAKGEYEAAADAAEAVLARDANQVDALLVLARVKAATSDSAGALAYYERVIARWPNDAAVLYEIASLERLTGSTSSAVPHLEKALALEPDNQLYLDELVKGYVATGKAREAAELLLERAGDAGRTAAARADLYVSASGAFIAARAESEAKAAAEKALVLSPKHPAAMRLLEQLK
jgi:tetratricopeptide (TPR) repeat protein